MKNNSPWHGANCIIVLKGGGEMASGVAVRLHRAGFVRLFILETDKPLAVRRAVSFCEAVYDGEQQVEDITAKRVDSPDEAAKLWENGIIPVGIDPGWKWLEAISPNVSIDAVIAKRNLGTRIDEAPLVVALGPGFAAGRDAHVVVETQRGHNLGKLIGKGEAEANTGIPGNIGGYTVERVVRAPVAGRVEKIRDIGDMVAKGEAVCRVGDRVAVAGVDGMLRGMIRPGVEVSAGLKLGDVDPRGSKEYCFTVSEKARALGGSVLEAVCAYINTFQGACHAVDME